MKYTFAILFMLSTVIPGFSQATKNQSVAPKAPVAKPAPKKAALPAFSKNPAVAEFIARMSEQHEFDVAVLTGQFSQISPNQRVLNLFRPSVQPSQKPPVRSWKKYSSNFLGEARIEGGINFWKENAETLKRAHEQYGVPPEIIVAIIGVETMYGRHTGNFGVMEALASLGFHDEKRRDFFRTELEHFLLLSRENSFNPLATRGSYAGAIGIPQFMPGSWRKYAVDFDGDGLIDLENNVVDSIGSIGNYLKEHGWQAGEPVAHRVRLTGKPKSDWLEAGMLPSIKVSELTAAGVVVTHETPDTATFIQLPTPNHPTEYWIGYQNYYAITRYNRSTFYAMSVFLLAEAIVSKQ